MAGPATGAQLARRWRAAADAGPRGGRRWLRPKRILLILATLVVVLVLATVGLYFSLNSKLTRVNVLAPTG